MAFRGVRQRGAERRVQHPARWSEWALGMRASVHQCISEDGYSSKICGHPQIKVPSRAAGGLPAHKQRQAGGEGWVKGRYLEHVLLVLEHSVVVEVHRARGGLGLGVKEVAPAALQQAPHVLPEPFRGARVGGREDGGADVRSLQHGHLRCHVLRMLPLMGVLWRKALVSRPQTAADAPRGGRVRWGGSGRTVIGAPGTARPQVEAGVRDVVQFSAR